MEWIEKQYEREQELKLRHVQAEQDRLLALRLAGVVVSGGGSPKTEEEKQKQAEDSENKDKKTKKKDEKTGKPTENNKQKTKEPETHVDKNRSKNETQTRTEGMKENVKEESFDLSEWSYSQIRDAINTSCDPQLLQACHREFDLRRKEYHRTVKRKKGCRRVNRVTPQPVS